MGKTRKIDWDAGAVLIASNHDLVLRTVAARIMWWDLAGSKSNKAAKKALEPFLFLGRPVDVPDRATLVELLTAAGYPDALNRTAQLYSVDT